MAFRARKVLRTFEKRAPGLHLPLEEITEDFRNFGFVQISNSLKKSWKRSQTLQWSGKEIQEGERCHTQYISRFGPAFRPLSCILPCSLGTDLTGIGVVASMPPGGIAGVLCEYFLCFGFNQKEIQNTRIFIHPCVIKASKRDTACLKSFQWQQCHRWRTLQWFRTAIWRMNSQETS